MTRKKKEELPSVPYFPIPDKIPEGVVLGTTHLWYEGEFRRLLKCPYCNFHNIHDDTMQHHIRYTDDKPHRGKLV